MNTLIIYDNEGKIFSQVTGDYLIPQGGVQFLEVEVLEGKQITGVDTSVTPHQTILEDILPTQVEILETQVADLTYQLMLNGVL